MSISWTAEDYSNAAKYAARHKTILLLQKANEITPQITSHFIISETDATDEDFYIPPKLVGRAKIIKVKQSEKSCTKMSCNPTDMTGAISRSRDTGIYSIGTNGQFALNNQPACYNLRTDIEIDKETIQSVRVEWDPKAEQCNYLSQLSTWLEAPRYRDDKAYVKRLNNLAAGFDRSEGNPTIYDYNKYYCDVFGDEFDPDSKTCYVPGWQSIVEAIIGTQITAMIKIAVTSGLTENLMPAPDLPDPPAIPSWMYQKQWAQDIDTSFTIPPIDNTNSYSSKTFIRAKPGVKRSKTEINPHLKNKNSRSERYPQKSLRTNNDFSQAMSDIGNMLVEMIGDPMFYASIGIDLGSDMALSAIKKLCKNLAEKLTANTIKILSETVTSIGTKLLQTSFRVMLTQTIKTTVLKVASKLAIALLRLGAAASSVIGIVLMIISAVDIILMFWDPLGFNNKYPPTLVNETSIQGIYDIRRQLASPSPEFSFELYVSMLLTHEELMSIELETLPYIIEYLDAIEVNSNGAVIDKGDVIEVPPEISLPELNQIEAQQRLYTQEDFELYEDAYQTAARICRATQTLGFIVTFIGVASITVMGSFGILLSLLGLVILGYSFLAITDSDHIGKYINISKLNKFINIDIKNKYTHSNINYVTT